ncbi:squalene cyclase [Micrococcales bacterium 31B]|nr:squalene cyclase [Micrococcales bacterium 31B]
MTDTVERSDTTENVALEWLLRQDPSVSWQARRDLAGEPASAWLMERSRVGTTGRGAKLLAMRGDDGQWSGGSFVPAGFDWETIEAVGQPWTATCWALQELREMGIFPATLGDTVSLIGANSEWDHAGEPYWSGEVEECINGRTVAEGSYFGVNMTTLVRRLLGEQQSDGGWNCERAHGSTASSFHSTINVLEGLLVYELAQGGDAASAAARASGEEYLLARGLFRSLRSGETVDPTFLQLLYPHRWHYTVPRALDYFRSSALYSGSAPDPRLAPAIEWLRGRRDERGLFPLDGQLRGAALLAPDARVGAPSPRLTLVGSRVLAWWDAANAGAAS